MPELMQIPNNALIKAANVTLCIGDLKENLILLSFESLLSSLFRTSHIDQRTRSAPTKHLVQLDIFDTEGKLWGFVASTRPRLMVKIVAKL